MANNEETDLFKLQNQVVIDLLRVLRANIEQGKITKEQLAEIDKTIEQTIPSPSGYNIYESLYEPITSIDELFLRLGRIIKEYPFLSGVYKKYDAKIERPNYCINCGSEFPRTAQFCPDCGTKVTSPEEE